MSQDAEVRSDSFFQLTPDVVLDTVDEVLLPNGRPRCTGRAMALNSLENRVYMLQLEDDSEVVCKFYRPQRWTEMQILEEHSFLLRLLENEIPVVAPIVCRETGKTLFRTPQGILFTIFPKTRGRLLDELRPSQLETIGRYLGRMHGLSRSHKVQHRIWLNIPNYGDDALNRLDQSSFVRSPLGQRYMYVADAFLDLIEPILADVEAIPVHGDCHVGNILWDGEAPFLLDFDDMVIAPPAQDLWLVVPGRDEESRKQLDIILEAYTDFCDFDESTLSLIEPLRGLRLIHYTGWIAKRWEDPIFQRMFTQFASDAFWAGEIEALQEISELIGS